MNKNKLLLPLYCHSWTANNFFIRVPSAAKLKSVYQVRIRTPNLKVCWLLGQQSGACNIQSCIILFQS